MATVTNRVETSDTLFAGADTLVSHELAAVSALLEMGDRLGVLPLLSRSGVSAQQVAEKLELPTDSVAEYLGALAHARVMEKVGDTFCLCEDFPQLRYQAGYVSWAMNANRPFIVDARDYLLKGSVVGGERARDGRQVAVCSQWVGALGFYPEAFGRITSLQPRRFVDLGAGSGRLVIDVLLTCPGSTGVALDFDAGACVEAVAAAERAGVRDRITVVERSIQSIAEDPAVLDEADAIHAGFVCHDMMPDEADVAARVFANCHARLRKNGILAITDAVPYAPDERERRFSALMTYYHNRFMGRQLLTEEQWRTRLLAAGFATVDCHVLGLPSGRLFVATKR